MCRFTLYLRPPRRLSALVTEPDNSLVRQSTNAREREEPLNGDGFGVAWYAPDALDRPGLFRSITPAWNNANLMSLARVVRSPCILAHVRAATFVKSVAEVNCHPFSSGRWSLMNDGDVGGFARLRRRLLERLSDDAFASVQGVTDSEHVFALFLDHVRAHADAPSTIQAVDALRRTIDDLLELSVRHAGGEPSYLNFALSDGRRAFATRHAANAADDGESLHLCRGRRYHCEEGVCRMLDPDPDGAAVIVSSEALSDDGTWESVPRSHLVVADADRTVTLQPL